MGKMYSVIRLPILELMQNHCEIGRSYLSICFVYVIFSFRMQRYLISGGIQLQNTIFSVGHSNFTWDHFRSLIEVPDIGVVLDVRSNPRSRLLHFHKHELRYRLNTVGISYLHLGDQLGGRPADGSADYETMATTAPFLDGIAKVLEIAGRCRPALMCSENEPLECHRCLLVARHLAERHDAHIAHILRDGRIEPHEATEDRLLAKWRDGGDLFQTRTERLAVAYRLQSRKLGVRA